MFIVESVLGGPDTIRATNCKSQTSYKSSGRNVCYMYLKSGKYCRIEITTVQEVTEDQLE